MTNEEFKAIEAGDKLKALDGTVWEVTGIEYEDPRSYKIITRLDGTKAADLIAYSSAFAPWFWSLHTKESDMRDDKMFDRLLDPYL